MAGMVNMLRSYIKGRYPNVNTDKIVADPNSEGNEPAMSTEEPEEESEDELDELDEEEKYMRQLQQMEQDELRTRGERQQLMTRLKNQVANNNSGFGYQVCDMERLRRFLVLGSEFNTYYVTAETQTIQTIRCLKRLIDSNKYQAVVDLLDEYNREGRVAKDEQLITVLAICADHERVEVRRAAYEKVKSICNIPTKLFMFIDKTHQSIVAKRLKNPPQPQPYASKKRKMKAAEKEMNALKISENANDKEKSSSREPSENVDETQEETQEETQDDTATPPSKKRKKKNKVEVKEVKKVNTAETKSLGWGRMRRTGIAEFYVDKDKDACRLLYLLTKYKQRHNWDHKTVMQYTHPKMKGEDAEAKNLVVKYHNKGMAHVKDELEAIGSKAGVSEKISEAIAYIQTLDRVKNLKHPDDEEELVEILQRYGRRTQRKEFLVQETVGCASTKPNPEGKKSPIQIVREHIPTPFLNSVRVWELMLEDMPMTAMIRNLGKMTSLGLFKDKKNVGLVLDALTNTHRLRTARVHPIKILIAAEQYNQGGGNRGNLHWAVNQEIIKGLNDAFYLSFKQPELKKGFRTGLRYLLALDVSGSMQWARCLGCESLTPALATAAMAMVTWHIEEDENCDIMGFGGHFEDLKGRIKRSMTVQEAMHGISSLNFGATDCSLPMIYALEKQKKYDVFIVYTDNETDHDTWQPMDALRVYNHMMKMNSKLIVMGMSSAGFTIADPESPYALDVVGFDANVPELINNFVTGNKDMKCDVCDDCVKNKQQ